MAINEKIKNIKPSPNNPRSIKDDKLEALIKSIREFPQMLEKRPLVCFTDSDGKYVVLGGNMRLLAAKKAGLKEIPILLADDWSEDQRKEFIIKDNIGFGEWDWGQLADEWDIQQLEDWGLDVPAFAIMPSEDELIGEQKNKPAVMKITFESPEQLQAAEIDIQELIDRKYKGAYFSVSAGEI